MLADTSSPIDAARQLAPVLMPGLTAPIMSIELLPDRKPGLTELSRAESPVAKPAPTLTLTGAMTIPRACAIAAARPEAGTAKLRWLPKPDQVGVGIPSDSRLPAAALGGGKATSRPPSRDVVRRWP